LLAKESSGLLTLIECNDAFFTSKFEFDLTHKASFVFVGFSTARLFSTLSQTLHSGERRAGSILTRKGANRAATR